MAGLAGSPQSHGEMGYIRVIAADLDGTLLAPDHTLSPDARESVKEALSKGTCVCLASGRPANSMAHVARDLFESPDGLPIVCFNGALAIVMDPEGHAKRKLFEAKLPTTVVLMVLELSAEWGYPVQWCSLEHTLNNATSKEQEHLLRAIEEIDGNVSETHDLLALTRSGETPLKLVMVTGR